MANQGGPIRERSSAEAQVKRNPAEPVARAQRATAERQGKASGSPGQRPSTGQSRRRLRASRRPWWRGWAGIAAVCVVVIAIVATFIVIGNQSSSNARTPADSAVLRELTSVSPSLISAVGTGGLPEPLKTIKNGALPSSDGKPQILYIGGEFCPVCAGDRWSMINALSRFGTFSNLHYMYSAPNDGNLPTFTFYGSSYSSKYVDFVSKENEDRNSALLETLTDRQQQLLTSLGGDGYPFLDIAGTYSNGAAQSYAGGYDETVLTGKSQSQVAAALTNPGDPITRGIIGNANYLTAAVCKVTHNQPGNVCGVQVVQTIEKSLP
jgi:hypothetical protein